MNRISSRRPETGDLTSPYHQQLVHATDGECVLRLLGDQQHWICELAGSLCTEQVDKLHAPYTWTVRQVVAHCADAERVFGYRMMRLAAGDPTPLPGWDENAYAESRFGLGTLTNLMSELSTLRQSNQLLLTRIVPAAWDRVGEVDGGRITVRGLAWVTAAHLRHHLEIIQQRCGITTQPPAGASPPAQA